MSKEKFEVTAFIITGKKRPVLRTIVFFLDEKTDFVSGDIIIVGRLRYKVVSNDLFLYVEKMKLAK